MLYADLRDVGSVDADGGEDTLRVSVSAPSLVLQHEVSSVDSSNWIEIAIEIPAGYFGWGDLIVVRFVTVKGGVIGNIPPAANLPVSCSTDITEFRIDWKGIDRNRCFAARCSHSANSAGVVG